MCAAHLTSWDKLMFSCCDFSILMKTFHTIITLQGVQALQNLALLDTNFFQHICALTTYKVPEMSV